MKNYLQVMPSSTVEIKQKHSHDSSDSNAPAKRRKSKSKKLVPSSDPDTDSSSRIDSRQLPSSLVDFLSARPHIEISKSSNTNWTLDDFDAEEEELWIVECPRDLDVNQLCNQKFKFFEGNENFECKPKAMESEKYLTLIGQMNGAPKAFSVKQSGQISIRERKDLPPQDDDVIQSHHDSDNDIVPYPTNLKMRHPLLGFNYAEVEIKQEPDDEAYSSLKKEKKRKKDRRSDQREQSPNIKTEVSSPKKKSKRHSREVVTIKTEPQSQQDEESQPQEIQNKKRDNAGEWVTIKSEPLSQQDGEPQPRKSHKRKRDKGVESVAIKTEPMSQDEESPKTKKPKHDHRIDK